MRGSWHDESQTDPLRAARVPTGRPWSRKPTVAPPSGSLRVHDAINCAIRSLHGGLSSGKRVGFPTQNAPIASPSISVPGALSPRACRRIARRFARKRLEHQTGLEDPIGHAGQSVLRAGERMATRPATGIVVHVRGCEVAARPHARTGRDRYPRRVRPRNVASTGTCSVSDRAMAGVGSGSCRRAPLICRRVRRLNTDGRHGPVGERGDGRR